MMEVFMTRKNEAGQALIFTVVALGVLLMGFAGLGIDMGYLRYEKRLQQTAADTAAIAGASNLVFGGVGAGAQDAATANGFTDGSGNKLATCTGNDSHSDTLLGKICVQVNNPPTSGPHNGDANFVEAYVSAVQPTFFMRVLGIKSETVTARAVATYVGGGASSGCLYTLGTPSSSIEGVNVNGAVTLNAPTCGVVDNGDFNTKGNALTINTGSFGVAGAYNKNGGGGSVTCNNSSTCPSVGMPAAGDPLAGILTPPTVGTPVAFDAKNIVPGSTYNGISIPANKTVTFPAGVYVVTGSNFTVGANSQVLGTGVTFYFTNGATIDATGGGNRLDIQLSAPTTGQYAGILFYQDPGDTSGPQLGGDNNTFFQGVLYFPKAQLTFFGNDSFGSDAQYSIVIADSLAFSGSPNVTLNSNFSGLPGGVSIIKNAVLVE
jgi:hypothetical protein